MRVESLAVHSAGRKWLQRFAVAAIAVATSGCASTTVVRKAPKPFPLPEPDRRAIVEPPSADLPVPNDAMADELVRTALNLRGTPYRNGGSDTRGFDCSGFTQFVFAQVGLYLPRETREQYTSGEPVSVGTQQPGDLIFFSTTDPGPSHVAIVLDSDRFVHAPSERGVVRVESLALAYWSRRLLGIRRVALQ
jgi:hypothetical protein